MQRILWVVLSSIVLTGPAGAAGRLPPADQRFAAARGEEVPSFQRHVVPLLGRLGCNGRACHGSFQGQGGFRLSLFGYDFKSDHDALVGGMHPRTDRKNPADSLMLRKPALQVSHKGGKRLDVGTWQYHLVRRWIEAGAPPHREKDPTFVTLEVEPKEIVFSKIGESRQLKVIAHWSGGLEEDVTPLCRFRSNDEATASVDATGKVVAVGKGDTDVVAFYDNGVTPVQVILPVSDLAGPRYPAVPTPTRIDQLVVAKLRKLGIVPSEVCTDAEFLRRVSLDLTGTPPTPTEVLAFLADRTPDRRTRKIDELLNRPTYAAWWATRLCDYTANSERTGPLGGEQALNGEKSRQWYAWIHRRVRDNVPYDKLAEGIVLAVSRRPGQSYDDYCAEMSSYFRKDKPVDFAERPTMPYFWARRTVGSPENKALSFAHAFLGVSLQCAQCHKHPYDQWTRQDFDQFTAFFNGIRQGDTQRVRSRELKKAVGLTGDEDSGAYKRKFVALLQSGKLLPFKEVTVPAPTTKKRKPRPHPRLGRVITPKLLGGDEVAASHADPRQPIMDWIRQENNPFFARAFVNRVWATYFHAGLIEPTDDLNLANPPSNPALLDYLAGQFVARGYDMKWLHRTITSSRTYQLSWRPNATNRHDERNLSRAVLRRLPAEVISDALLLATASSESRKVIDADPITTRAIGTGPVVVGRRGARTGPGYAVTLFGKPPRLINCDCERSSEPSLLQTVYLRNDPEILALLDRPTGWLRELAGPVAAKGKRGAVAPPRGSLRGEPQELIREAYLRTLGRLPDDREANVARKHLADSGNTIAGLRDLMWALLNTREFVVNR